MGSKRKSVENTSQDKNNGKKLKRSVSYEHIKKLSEGNYKRRKSMDRQPKTLDKSKDELVRGIDCSNRLHDQASNFKESRSMMSYVKHKNTIEDKLKQEQDQCTFRPKINMSVGTHGNNFYDKATDWKRKVDKKKHDKIKDKLNKMESFTFKPTVSQVPDDRPDYKHINEKATQEFIHRQFVGRGMKNDVSTGKKPGLYNKKYAVTTSSRGFSGQR